MIKTITLNPALDKTIILDEFRSGQVNRVKKIFKDAGGKGINVSKMIRNLGGRSIATGVLAGATGSFIKNELERMEIEHNFIESTGETRTNLKLVDLRSNTFTDINEKGAFLLAKKLEELEALIFNDLEKDDLLVLSGSVPAGVSEHIYEDWINKAKGLQIKTILDVDGPLFKNGVKAGPTLIKPNNHELSAYFSTEMIDREVIINSAVKLFEYGVEMIMVSLGSAGAIFLTADKRIVIEPLSLDVKSTVGAGDAMVGALALGITEGMGMEEMITLSVAASSASLLNNGTEMGTKDQILNLKSQIKYYYL
ncbi:1-phosphofructokinase [Halocella sp. SP3-1]|uniref:1-phosphofructokinase n=1 Tax=Halocella sp. SP3-1 TaxID=2382161 RepID=UPI000F76112D|nr:1-phosphofructokinase [Halocella sp. SP3-1]AZO94404.1 1-phosphofructokinase [Halocella sp. SP3-1]